MDFEVYSARAAAELSRDVFKYSSGHNSRQNFAQLSRGASLRCCIDEDLTLFLCANTHEYADWYTEYSYASQPEQQLSRDHGILSIFFFVIT